MEPEEWKRRCAARYIERAEVGAKLAREMAEVTFVYAYEDEPEDPECCADEDMDCWVYD